MINAKGSVTRKRREPISTETRKHLHRLTSYTYVLCGVIGQGATHTEKTRGFEIDHIKPNAAGGDASIENLQVLFRERNNSKR
jgi:hypothetical protein